MLALLKILTSTPLGMGVTGLLAILSATLFYVALKNVNKGYANMMGDAAIAGLGSVADNLRKQQKNKK